jgi:hypothetical protein
MKQRPILFSTPMVKAILSGDKTQTRREVKPQPPINCIDDEPCIQYDRGVSRGSFECPELYAEWECNFLPGESSVESHVVFCPYGKPGDVLWVRESYRIVGWNLDDSEMIVEFKDGARKTIELDDDQQEKLISYIERMESKGVIQVPDDYDVEKDGDEWDYEFIKEFPWKPSIHMPKAVCRTYLQISGIRAERLQYISEEDAISEGVQEIHPAPFVIRWENYLIKDSLWDCAIGSFHSLWESINGKQSWDSNPWVWVVEFERIEKPVI